MTIRKSTHKGHCGLDSELATNREQGKSTCLSEAPQYEKRDWPCLDLPLLMSLRHRAVRFAIS